LESANFLFIGRGIAVQTKIIALAKRLHKIFAIECEELLDLKSLFQRVSALVRSFTKVIAQSVQFLSDRPVDHSLVEQDQVEDSVDMELAETS
jgi:hypothetical protein